MKPSTKRSFPRLLAECMLFLFLATAAVLLSPGCGGGGSSSNNSNNNPPARRQASAPTFSPAAGTYTSSQSVTISSTTSGATIYYTTDGSTPTTSSTRYSTAITVGSTQTLKAIAVASGFDDSTVSTAAYTINLTPAATPSFSPAAGAYNSVQTVTISSTTTGATIYYTTDGSTPTTSSARYSAPVTVGYSQTLKAIAVASGYSSSAAASGSYSITLPAPSYTWKNVQIIAGGFVSGIRFHPAEQNLIYARTDIGGAYRWDTVNSQWIPLTDWIGPNDSNYMGIESIGLDPSDPQRLYLAAGTYVQSWGGAAAFLISTDQGRTFTTVPVSFKMGGNCDGRNGGERFAVDPNLGSKLYYGSYQNGLWTSTDHGAHWSQVSTFPVTGATSGAGIIFVEFLKSSGTSGSATPVIYVGVSDNTTSYARVYRSTDAGATWSAVPGQPAALSSQYPNHGQFDSNGTLYMTFGNAIGPNGMSTGKVMKYTPTPGNASGPGTWTDITPPNPSYPTNGSWGYGGLAVDPSNPGTLMVMTMDLWYQHDNMYRSLDGGATWIELGATSVRDASLSPYVNWGNSSPGVGNWAQIAIDPFNAGHVLYATGATVWASTDVRSSETTTPISGSALLLGGVTHWTIGAKGIEETAVLALASPPSGTAHLISGLGDIGGFMHTDLDSSPAGGMMLPYINTIRSLDFAQNNPSFVVRVGDSSPYGEYSSNGGTTWTGFATVPSGMNAPGTVAVSADGSTIVWAPGNAAISWSANNGTSWTASTGAPSTGSVYADRFNSSKFYIYRSGTLYRSTDGGRTFASANPSLATSGNLTVSWAAEGDLWLASSNGLFHSTDSGTTFTQMAGVQNAFSVGFGKAAAGRSYPVIFLTGRINSLDGIFRSDDAGQTWVRINDDQHQWGYYGTVVGDPRIFGRVYLGTGSGRGIVYGDSAY